jgi:hypothetical protein
MHRALTLIAAFVVIFSTPVLLAQPAERQRESSVFR